MIHSTSAQENLLVIVFPTLLCPALGRSLKALPKGSAGRIAASPAEIQLRPGWKVETALLQQGYTSTWGEKEECVELKTEEACYRWNKNIPMHLVPTLWLFTLPSCKKGQGILITTRGRGLSLMAHLFLQG